MANQPSKTALLALAALLSAAVVALNKIIEDAPATPPVDPGSLPRGLRNNNPGNLVKSDTTWTGKITGTDPKFESFYTPYHGTRALVKNLLAYRNRTPALVTVKDIITRWAPASDGNNTAAYISAVSAALKVTSTAKLPSTAEVYANLAWQIACHENGRAAMDKHYPYSTFYADAYKAFNT